MMKLSITVCILLSFFASMKCIAQEHHPAAKPSVKILFNSEDLSGWKQVGGNPDHRGTFHTEDGTIVGTYIAGTSNTFLVTEQVFDDFILEFEFLVQDGINSGVQFRSTTIGDKHNRVSGYQFEIDPSARAWTAGVYHEAGRGWLYPLEFNPSAKTLLRINEWNTARIECVGTSIRTWLNSKPVTHLIDDHASSGFIALQVHGIGGNSPLAGRTIRWRNLRMHPAPKKPTPPLDDLFIRNLIPNDVSDAESTQGWQSLFDGTSSENWRGFNQDSFPSKGWEVENNELILANPDDNSWNNIFGGHKIVGDIITREKYSAFEFQLDVMPTTGANSGIKYFITERKGASPIGFEYQILDDNEHPDAKKGIDGNRTMASLYDLIPSARSVNGRDVPRHVNKWNHVRIVVTKDKLVQHWLNGYKVVEFTRDSEQFRSLITKSKFRGNARFGLEESGHILLQDHGDEVRFRSIKIRPLQ